MKIFRVDHCQQSVDITMSSETLLNKPLQPFMKKLILIGSILFLGCIDQSGDVDADAVKWARATTSKEAQEKMSNSIMR
jgi:hypothetical protein